ncbi:MAG: YraN family protein [Elusimicrobia bacterium]|nr:YraN family protein [Elusimicrobiota bacterium]
MSRSAGAEAEAAAARYLTGLGYEILDRNFRGRFGEIDIIAQDGEAIVFVEVRARSDCRFGAPEETVGPAKRRKIIKTALLYLQSRGIADDTLARFDVIAIESGRINHIPGAFEVEGH